MANDARFLRCDTEKECFFPMPMEMVLVRARMKSLFFHGMKKIEKHIELCENFHTDYYIDLLIFIYFHLSNLTQVLLKQSIKFLCKGKGKVLLARQTGVKRQLRPWLRKCIIRCTHHSMRHSLPPNKHLTIM